MASTCLKEETSFHLDIEVYEWGQFEETQKEVKCEATIGKPTSESDEHVAGRGSKGRWLPNSFNLVRCHINPRLGTSFRRTSFRILRRVSLMGSMAEDYYHMSQNKKSEYCAKLHPGPILVQCWRCGQPFLGRNRILVLLQHIQNWHHAEARALTLHLMKIYKHLLMIMRVHIGMDRRLIASFYG